MRKSLGDPAGKEHFSPRAGSPPASYEPDQRDNTAGAMHYRLSAWQTAPTGRGSGHGGGGGGVFGGGAPLSEPRGNGRSAAVGGGGKGKKSGRAGARARARRL